MTEHAPLLRFLVALTAPRRYVELGTHNGMSLFAASQAAEDCVPNMECVAIDLWEGDEHAGRFEDDVYAGFELRAESWPSELTAIRATFDAARPRFEAGSIDMLLIDGLHTYEAVKHDFETWITAVADGGLVLLHDISVRERGFGVWRFWQEISRAYPSIAIDHSHGLGILVVGDGLPLSAMPEDWPDLEQLLNWLSEAAGQQEFAFVAIERERQRLDEWRHHLEGVVVEYDKTVDYLKRELAAQRAAIDEERQEFRTENDALRGVVNEMQGSRSWRLLERARRARRRLSR